MKNQIITTTTPLLPLGLIPNQSSLSEMAKKLGIPDIKNVQNNEYKNVILAGRPIPINFNQQAKSERSPEGVPSIENLTSTLWLEENYYHLMFKNIYCDDLFRSLGKDVIDGVLVSDVSLKSENGNVFLFATKFVDYTQVLQFVSTSSGSFSVGSNKVVSFDNGTVNFEKSVNINELTGIGKILTIIKKINFQKHFSSPGEMSAEEGSGFDMLEGGNYSKARRLFAEYLQNDLIAAILKYSSESLNIVKGFTCSFVKMNTKISDSGISIGTSSTGTIQMAFSLLI
ncbi:MAG: hypothetical protein NTZ44_03230 [Candidatus Nomurabacteria bacterium]|nr:hypothetical protein [Candidatus Nomurabacteria bacterium]